MKASQFKELQEKAILDNVLITRIDTLSSIIYDNIFYYEQPFIIIEDNMLKYKKVENYIKVFKGELNSNILGAIKDRVIKSQYIII